MTTASGGEGRGALATDSPTTAPAWLRARHGLRQAVIDERDGPLPAMLVALTVLAGVVDAASILGLGHVFVATMTGNLVFVGLALAGAKGFAISPCLLSIGGFIVGALAGGHACRSARGHRGCALRNVLAVKLALATVVTAIIVSVDGHPGTGTRDIAVVLLAASMGCQLAAIRYLKVPDLLTVVLTLTITGALTERGLGLFHPAVLRRAIAVVAFAVGAISGGVLVVDVSLSAALGLGLAIIVSVAIAAYLASRSSGDWTTR
ncbi:MAG: YoaK family protein [Solirubrobacteraceae bacterium]